MVITELIGLKIQKNPASFSTKHGARMVTGTPFEGKPLVCDAEIFLICDADAFPQL